jgi:hypothetical protein
VVRRSWHHERRAACQAADVGPYCRCDACNDGDGDGPVLMRRDVVPPPKWQGDLRLASAPTIIWKRREQLALLSTSEVIG